MEIVYQIQGVLIGLIGWAATALLTMSSSKLNAPEQRAMMVCAWAVWMIPAAGALVYRGLITADTAVIYCGTTTVLLAVLAMVSSISWRKTRP
jgi:uncharacterized membrane protein